MNRSVLKYAAVVLLLCVVILGAVFAGQAKATVSYGAQETAFVNLLNQYRAANGLKPLLVSDKITEACDRHGSDMGKYAFFSHYSLRSDWFAYNATPWTRMAVSGYTYYTNKGENIAAGMASADQALGAWKTSPGHNANMLNATYKVLGVSLVTVPGSPYTYYWVTDFGGYVDSTAHAIGQLPYPDWPTLRRGMTSIYIGQMKTLLNRAQGAGLAPTNLYFGDATFREVREFQAAHGLYPDGVVGPLTEAKLKAH